MVGVRVTQKIDIILSSAAPGPGPITLDPETRKRFVRALAELVAEAILREQQQKQHHEQQT